MVDEDPRCGRCGYLLLGLPQAGRCPECGQVYDVVRGEGLRQPRAMVPLTGAPVLDWLGVVLAIGFAVLLLICGGLLALIARNPLKPLAAAGLAAAVLLAVAGFQWLLRRPRG